MGGIVVQFTIIIKEPAPLGELKGHGLWPCCCRAESGGPTAALGLETRELGDETGAWGDMRDALGGVFLGVRADSSRRT